MSLFTQTGVSLSHINKLSSQTIEQTIERALALLDHQDWKEGKTFTEDHVFQVHTAKLQPMGSEKLPWHKRTSLHPPDRDITYDEFRNGLLLDHTVNEQQYIPDMKYCSKVKAFREELPEAEVYLIQYKMPLGTTNREFASLVITNDLPFKTGSSDRSFIVVQVPVLDVPVSKGFVRGKYASVEHVEEITDSHGKKSVKWRMATASSAGGVLPQIATDLALPSQISHDVPNFINWAKAKSKENQPLA